MSRGPLPDPNARRRNAPTIPTTNLPASGFAGPAPAVPSWVKLGKSGKAWWRWAWSTPQASAWGANVGQEGIVARRASIEDDIACIELIHGIDFDGVDDSRDVTGIVQRVAALATGRLALMREMRELDDRLGLTPKGMAALRWVVVEDKPAEPATPPTTGVTRLDDRRSRLANG